MTVGERLKEWRGTLSQKAAALACGIKQQAWNRWEKDETEPGADSIRKICAFFNRSADELLGIDRGTSAAPQIKQTAVGNNNRLTATVGNAGEMPVCRNCPKVAALQDTLATIMQAARTAASKPPRSRKSQI